eukprot:TRINITY_DN18178_c0_g1_i1.p1 TRINITY_DN18178_c0_g1~~TRINITY_DN18178_c0_g1_i1.p1  ORF type:complete len:325 (+),score=50.78 TRINITY_DN18178_c0_g1_i1:133-1107(+)
MWEQRFIDLKVLFQPVMTSQIKRRSSANHIPVQSVQPAIFLPSTTLPKNNGRARGVPPPLPNEPFTRPGNAGPRAVRATPTPVESTPTLPDSPDSPTNFQELEEFKGPKSRSGSMQSDGGESVSSLSTSRTAGSKKLPVPARKPAAFTGGGSGEHQRKSPPPLPADPEVSAPQPVNPPSRRIPRATGDLPTLPASAEPAPFKASGTGVAPAKGQFNRTLPPPLPPSEETGSNRGFQLRPTKPPPARPPIKPQPTLDQRGSKDYDFDPSTAESYDDDDGHEPPQQPTSAAPAPARTGFRGSATIGPTRGPPTRKPLGAATPPLRK